MANTYLYRTFTAGDPEKWTWSAWVKRGSIGATQGLFAGHVDDQNRTDIKFNSSDEFVLEHIVSNSYVSRHIYNRVFSDPAAWYHIVVVWDTPNASEHERQRLYINGVEENSWGTATNCAQDTDSWMNNTASTVACNIGLADANYFEGDMAHVHYADGQAYAPTVFGEFDSTSGIWVPKTSPSVTYGTNGYFLKFASGASGTDNSGEGNNMTVSGTLTNLKDSPSNNFCTWNPLGKRTDQVPVFTNGNTSVKTTNSSWGSVGGTQIVKSGKWYYEAVGGNTSGPGYMHYGFCAIPYFENGGANYGYMGEPGTGITFPCYTYYGSNGNVYYNTTSASGQTAAYGNTYTSTDYIGVFLDLDNSKMYWSKNGTIQNSGTGQTIDNANSDFWTPVTGNYNDASAHETNFGNGYFGTTVLTGTTYSDANSKGIFKYSPNDGGASSFDSAAKNFYALTTSNIKLYGG